jgi:mannose-1-phosphate guanylyltransferase
MRVQKTGMFFAVIMAGGSGTRLWPMSRRNHPKQSLKLFGERTLFQQAVDRLKPLFSPDQIMVVTKSDLVPLLRDQSPELPAENFVVEPEGRGTAPALGLAAIHLKRRDPEAIMAVMTADHFIADTGSFHKVLASAQTAAKADYLVTFGIIPTFASSGYGYIEKGESLPLEADHPVFRVRRFIEKPDAEDAVRMASSGEFLWNSGMFAWRVQCLLDELQRQMPDFYTQLMEVEASFRNPEEYGVTIGRVWPQVAEQTIDYGVMEGARNVAVIPVQIGWTDVGTWSSLFELIPCDSLGNILVGTYETIDTRETLVMGSERLIATIGVENLVIVDTEDALLVCSKDSVQDVRLIVKRLEKAGHASWI